jgi:hypothetical protein
MARSWGSWGPLLLGAVVFLGAFAWQRSQCPTLLVEAEAATAREIAARTNLPVADVMALWEVSGVPTEPTELELRCRGYADMRVEVGDALAAAMVCEPATADEWQAALRASGGDKAKALAGWRRMPSAAVGERFLSRRERYLARAAAR